MEISWFVTFRHATARASDADLARVAAITRDLEGTTEILLFTPAQSHDPYLDDGAPPPLVVQVKFAEIAALEAALHGPVAELADLPSLAGAEIGEQALLTRVFPVPDATFAHAPGEMPCTYLVAYEGEAEDMNAWLSHYVAHHPPIMARFPGIRGIEIYTRLDWCSATGWRRETAMQRNKVVFDSPAALTAALNSPVRHEMRADFARFPPFSGRNTHFPMWTQRLG
jgi:uncharacterized protein (TIGR02118 family)